MTPDEARAFIAKSRWIFAETMPWAPHEYCARRTCFERGIEPQFVAFARLIQEAGYNRRWGGHLWRSLAVDDRTYWLHRIWFPPEQRTIINRWVTAKMA